eukprot:8342084-Pyramimonas_sp.AAC.1
MCLGHQKHKRRWTCVIEKPVRWVRRAVRRVLGSQGKGTRLHDRGIPPFLASLTEPQCEDIFL